MSSGMAVLLYLLIVLVPLVTVGSFELAKSCKQKVDREIARKRWEAERRELNIRQLERENADFEGWLERLHNDANNILAEYQEWVDGTSLNPTLKEVRRLENGLGKYTPPYRPDLSLITYIERGQK